jgi:hypothetical protein
MTETVLSNNLKEDCEYEWQIIETSSNKIEPRRADDIKSFNKEIKIR